MSFKLKAILIALTLILALMFAVAFVLNHYIGEFLRRVEEEERQKADNERM